MGIGIGIGISATLGGAGGPSEPSIGLQQITNDRIHQRSIGDTDGPVTLSGSYAGGTPAAIEAKVLLVADDSTIVDWTEVDATPSAGAWSGALTVPQGGPYYVQARWSDDTDVTVEGITQFFVGALIIGYGQSNWLGHVSTSSSPPAANASTRYFDGDSWETVPSGNGIRELLNFLATDTGLPWGLVSGGQSGVPLDWLQEGSGDSTAFADLAAKIAAMGGDAECIVFHQGEGDAHSSGPVEGTYIAGLNTLHGSLVDEVSRTRAQCPMFVSSLATVVDAAQSDLNWSIVQSALVKANASHEHIHYSHSNLDAALSDTVHWTAASYGRSGRRYAQSIADLLGTESASPAWFIDSVDIVDATHTDVTLVHSIGTDFTPTSAISGFEVSDDNGANWEAPSAARQDATTIRLTHSSMSLNDDRLVRYQYGDAPDVSAPVVDDSALASPLNHSAHQVLTAEGSANLPVPTFIRKAGATGSGTTQTLAATNLGDNTNALLVVVTGTIQAGLNAISALTLTPNGGSAINATMVQNCVNSGPEAWIATFLVPASTPGSDNCALSVTYPVNPFATTRFGIWTIPADDLNSQTAVDVDTSRSTSVTSRTVDLTTEDGGLIIACAISNNATANNCTWTGDEAGLAEASGFDDPFSGAQHSGASAAATGAETNANTVTATFAQSASTRLSAASWR